MRFCKEGCGRPVKAPKDTMCMECRRVYEKARYNARTARTVAWRKKARAAGLLPVFKLRQGESAEPLF